MTKGGVLSACSILQFFYHSLWYLFYSKYTTAETRFFYLNWKCKHEAHLRWKNIFKGIWKLQYQSIVHMKNHTTFQPHKVYPFRVIWHLISENGWCGGFGVNAVTFYHPYWDLFLQKYPTAENKIPLFEWKI